jgi:integrase
MKTEGMSIKTANLMLDAIKAFCAWMVLDRRMSDNPLAHLAGGNVRTDRRRDRRTLSPEELRKILDAAQSSTRSFRGLNGRDRWMIYLVAMTKGFRAEEIATLTPALLELDTTPPVAVLPAKATKNRKGARQPLPADVVEALREYLSGCDAKTRIWDGRWFEVAAEMLRGDLAVAEIPYVVQSADGPAYADFHALRHSYIASLDRVGATLKEAMQLARHSDPKLTMAVYGRAGLSQLSERVDRLSGFVSEQRGVESEKRVCTPVCTSVDSDCDSVRRLEGEKVIEGVVGVVCESAQLLIRSGVESKQDCLRLQESNSPRATLIVKILSKTKVTNYCGTTR